MIVDGLLHASRVHVVAILEARVRKCVSLVLLAPLGPFLDFRGWFVLEVTWNERHQVSRIRNVLASSRDKRVLPLGRWRGSYRLDVLVHLLMESIHVSDAPSPSVLGNGVAYGSFIGRAGYNQREGIICVYVVLIAAISLATVRSTSSDL